MCLCIIIWLAPRAGKMTQIARCVWLPERVRWSHLARSGLPAMSRKQNYPESHIINPLLTKFARSRWLDIGLVLFLRIIDLDFVSVHKLAKKELGQYPAILTSHLVNNNLSLTEREGRTGEYWPEVVAVPYKTTEGQYSPVRLELARLVSSLF